MKIGLIARCETSRGIAIQSKGFYDHMPVDRTLLVRMPKPDCEERPDWYANRTEVAYDAKNHQLDEVTVRGWLDGLDVVFTVETPNDWRMPTWCREAGVKLVIQGNPEFVRHGQPGFDLPHPDAWWWPTNWRYGHHPPGPVVPVPMPDDVPVRRDDTEGPLRVLHVIGKRAYADRNGTDPFISALRRTRERMHVTLYSIDGMIPKVPTPHQNRRLTIDYIEHGVDDRWEMYRNQDVLVLPRRYGGLCLPALEATACGLAVVMPDIPPNDELAETRFTVARTLPISLACGRVQAAEPSPAAIADVLDRMAADRKYLLSAKDRQSVRDRRWYRWSDIYLDRFEDLLNAR